MKNMSDAELETTICSRLRLSDQDASERAWSIASHPDVGRYLVAARDLAADELVFCEEPLVVATPRGDDEERAMRGELAAVAIELLREPSDSLVHLLCEADFSADKDGSLAGSMRTWTMGMLRALKAQPPLHRADGSAVTPSDDAVSWALSVASVNVHGNLTDPPRGVLGLLASMMMHSCAPSAYTDIASMAEGSALTLRTKRAVRAGERLSISYVTEGTPLVERRRQLRLQHGFVCQCERCVAELAAEAAEADDADGPAGATSRAAPDWRQGWENRAWTGCDPYSGEPM